MFSSFFLGVGYNILIMSTLKKIWDIKKILLILSMLVYNDGLIAADGNIGMYNVMKKFIWSHYIGLN